MPHTYMLRCSDGSYYVGSARTLDARLAEHAAGGCSYTRRRRPVELVWAQEFDRIDDAWVMERRVHGWSRAKKEALARGDWDEIRRLARGGARGPVG